MTTLFLDVEVALSKYQDSTRSYGREQCPSHISFTKGKQ